MTAERDVEAAISTVEDSRRTHVEWRDYWLSLDCAGCETCRGREQVAGGIEHHEKCIAGYDHVLTVLRSHADALAQARREGAAEVEARVLAALDAPNLPPSPHATGQRLDSYLAGAIEIAARARASLASDQPVLPALIAARQVEALRAAADALWTGGGGYTGGVQWGRQDYVSWLHSRADVLAADTTGGVDGEQPCPKHRALGVNPGCPDCDHRAALRGDDQ